MNAVVVNYNSGSALGRCIETLLADGVDRVVVIDNCSSDRSLSGLQEYGPRVELFEAGVNLGFGAGVNAGMNRASSELVLVCNPDVVLTPGVVDALVTRIGSDASLAVVGPQLVDGEGRAVVSARAFPTLGRSSVQAFVGLLRPSGPLAAGYAHANQMRIQRGEVDWVTGACILVRRSSFEAVGGFDAGYFLYVEEVDLCWRLRRAGWHIAFEPMAVVIHQGGVSTSQHPFRATITHHRSLWRFWWRTTTGRDRIAFPIVLIALVLRSGLALVLKLIDRWVAISRPRGDVHSLDHHPRDECRLD